MVQSIEKGSTEATNKSVTNLIIGVYTIYDCVLKLFSPPVSIPVTRVNDYFSLLVNDVKSPYYNHESDYIVNKIGVFNQDTGEIELHFVERVCMLDSFINHNKRNLQTIIQTLNFLPTGYYKMPSEQKEQIQNDINTCVQRYVENYVVPDLDISSEKIKSLEATIADYEDRLGVVNHTSV